MEFNTQVTAHKDNTYAVAINVDFGFFTPEDMITIGELAKKHNVTKIMATTAKKISFYNVAEADVNPLWDDIKAAFGDRLHTPKGKIIVCPGHGNCKFAMPGFDGHALAARLVKVTQAHNAGKLKLAVATCPRCCSMAQVRDVGVYAAAKGWTVTVGGNGGAKPAVGTPIAKSLSDDEVVALVDKIYAYIEANKNGHERSAKLLARLGLDDLKKAVGIAD
ncbi:MAG: hypothetical protein Q4C56_09175 [Peptococcaceae bacterium]|nr:hypothetical protein [Peptococcaceae bacterium]